MPEFIFLSHEVMMEVLKITINNKKEEVTQDNNKDSFIKQANHQDFLLFQSVFYFYSLAPLLQYLT